MTAISAPRAHAVRRASIAAAGIASAIAAHMVAMGDLALLPVAPALWAMLIALAAVIGTRRAPFVARGMGATALLVVLSQMAMHVGMVTAPWAFGIAAHHAEPLLTPGSAVAHVVAAIVLVALVAWGERALAVLSAVARAVLSPAPRRPRRSGVVACVRPSCASRAPRARFLRATPSRGPPLPA
ncbi:MAG: hypothetical protein ISP32_04650 [Thermoleophilia bacterium]|nr:hypothetical protein [Thermoleophilia bacterium]